MRIVIDIPRRIGDHKQQEIDMALRLELARRNIDIDGATVTFEDNIPGYDAERYGLA